jgi:hypothetical protein
MSRTILKKGLGAYKDHLTRTAEVFNDHAKISGLRVTMDPTKAIRVASEGINIGRIANFWTRQDDTGIIHEAQLRTAVECIANLAENESQCGHVVGAMQSGKTTTSLALQWAGPALYRLKGLRAYPFYIIGNQRNHEDQTNVELDRFMTYYGHIELHVKKPQAKEDALFSLAPSLLTYREQVLRRRDAIYEVPRLDDLIHRRVGGDRSISKIVDLCERATNDGYRPLMIIDEPQFGASDRMVPGEDGVERRSCVLAQIFMRIQDALKSTALEHWFVGLSATPFEMNDVSQFWEVRQRLSNNYSGFNYFNQVAIDDDVAIKPPTTLSLTMFADKIKVPFLAQVALAAYDKEPTYKKLAAQDGLTETHAAYRAKAEAALRDTIYAVLGLHRDSKGPIGLCIRLFNDNIKMQAMMAHLNLDPARIEVLEYYGTETSGVSVKRAVAQRKRPDLPYLIVVTNRARMADAFPKQVKFFMDLAKQASNLNALLQGLLGRACGYDKDSLVVLSDANADIVEAYVATEGGYVHKTSNHSVAVGGGFRRGAPSSMIKLRADMKDPVVAQFFDRVNKQIVAEIPPGAKPKVKRARGREARRAPLLIIAEKLKLFDHLENPKTRVVLFPEYVTGFEVVRRNGVAQHRDSKETLRYDLNRDGECRFTFRHVDRGEAAKGGGAGRAKGKRDAGPQWIEPTVYIEKFNPMTGETIAADDPAVGSWRAHMITFPLCKAVKERVVATVAYPVETSPFDAYMNEGERLHRSTAKVRGVRARELRGR